MSELELAIGQQARFAFTQLVFVVFDEANTAFGKRNGVRRKIAVPVIKRDVNLRVFFFFLHVIEVLVFACRDGAFAVQRGRYPIERVFFFAKHF